jgi:UDP-N-acetylmuramate--alanine ligase
MVSSLHDFRNPFLIGIAGSGMSAIAQYLKGIGKNVSGSDRFFGPGIENETQRKLESEGIPCFTQNGEGITADTDLIIVSTAIEDTVIEVQKARQAGIPIIRRSEMLSIIAKSKKTIAIGGTSGKSTTSAMLFEVLEYAGMEPSIISGAGLISLMKKGKIGNAKVGRGEWLVIEADESDGSIVQYHADTGLLLNLDKDHQEIEELIRLFSIFRDNSQRFSVNRSHPLTAPLSKNVTHDFSIDDAPAGYMAKKFRQEGLTILFEINGTAFELQLIGRHNMENAVAAVAVANGLGISLETCAQALKQYQGIYRRVQVYGKKHGVMLVDDYAHNPVKCAAAINACHAVAPKVIAWFQPHGYKPTKFLREEFVKEISGALRSSDEIWMSEIFYAGGTAVKDISSSDLINDIRLRGKNAYYIEDRRELLKSIRDHFTDNCVLLLMGARDPSLQDFAQEVWDEL